MELSVAHKPAPTSSSQYRAPPTSHVTPAHHILLSVSSIHSHICVAMITSPSVPSLLEKASLTDRQAETDWNRRSQTKTDRLSQQTKSDTQTTSDKLKKSQTKPSYVNRTKAGRRRQTMRERARQTWSRRSWKGASSAAHSTLRAAGSTAHAPPSARKVNDAGQRTVRKPHTNRLTSQSSLAHAQHTASVSSAWKIGWSSDVCVGWESDLAVDAAGADGGRGV
eukprot:2469070-Rhodomonas_salina.1